MRKVYSLLLAALLVLICAFTCSAAEKTSVTIDNIVDAFNKSKIVEEYSQYEGYDLYAEKTSKGMDVVYSHINWDNQEETITEKYSFTLNGTKLSGEFKGEDDVFTGIYYAQYIINAVEELNGYSKDEYMYYFMDEQILDFTYEEDGIEITYIEGEDSDDISLKIDVDISRKASSLDFSQKYAQASDFDEDELACLRSGWFNRYSGFVRIIASCSVDEKEFYVSEYGGLGENSFKSVLTMLDLAYGENASKLFIAEYGHESFIRSKITENFTVLLNPEDDYWEDEYYDSIVNCGLVKVAVHPLEKTVLLSDEVFTYNGSIKKPEVMLEDKYGSEIDSSKYTVTYPKGCKNVGTYEIEVKCTDPSCIGTYTATFKIKPAATSISSLTAAKKGFTVKWKKKTAQTTGYQVRYSTSSSMSNAKVVTVSSNKTVSKKISNLKSSKKYYVQVRTYKTVDGTKYYSSWSAKKSVKTK